MTPGTGVVDQVVTLLTPAVARRPPARRAAAITTALALTASPDGRPTTAWSAADRPAVTPDGVARWAGRRPGTVDELLRLAGAAIGVGSFRQPRSRSLGADLAAVGAVAAALDDALAGRARVASLHVAGMRRLLHPDDDRVTLAEMRDRYRLAARLVHHLAGSLLAALELPALAVLAATTAKALLLVPEGAGERLDAAGRALGRDLVAQDPRLSLRWATAPVDVAPPRRLAAALVDVDRAHDAAVPGRTGWRAPADQAGVPPLLGSGPSSTRHGVVWQGRLWAPASPPGRAALWGRSLRELAGRGDVTLARLDVDGYQAQLVRGAGATLPQLLTEQALVVRHFRREAAGACRAVNRSSPGGDDRVALLLASADDVAVIGPRPRLDQVVARLRWSLTAVTGCPVSVGRARLVPGMTAAELSAAALADLVAAKAGRRAGSASGPAGGTERSRGPRDPRAG